MMVSLRRSARHNNYTLRLLANSIVRRTLADGFNRSESCVAILLQNSLDAKRSYGTLMSVKMEQYGDLRGVFTNYSTEHYKEIIMEAYKEAGVDPASVAYIEADGCGIKVSLIMRNPEC